MKEYRMLDAIVEFNPLIQVPLNDKSIDQTLEPEYAEVFNTFPDYRVVCYWLENHSQIPVESIRNGALELRSDLEELYEPIHIDRFDRDFLTNFSVQDQFIWSAANEVLISLNSNKTRKLQGFFKGLDLLILKEISLNPYLQGKLFNAEQRFNQEDAEKVFTQAGIIQIARRYLEEYENLQRILEILN